MRAPNPETWIGGSYVAGAVCLLAGLLWHRWLLAGVGVVLLLPIAAVLLLLMGLEIHNWISRR